MTKLQDHIDSLSSPSLSFAESIQAMTDLIPGLEAVVPTEFGYFVKHPDYEGIGNLDDVGNLLLDRGSECRSKHAPLEVRLTHQSVEFPIFDVYHSCHILLDEAMRNGTVPRPAVDPNVGACRPIPSDPFTLIFSLHHELIAFTFDEEEYKSLWGDEPPAHRTGLIKPDETYVSTPVASREQVERALRKSKTPTGDVKDQTEETAL